MFGVDTDTMESVVLQMLRERGLTLGLAESVTGGLVAGRLTGIEGASTRDLYLLLDSLDPAGK